MDKVAFDIVCQLSSCKRLYQPVISNFIIYIGTTRSHRGFRRKEPNDPQEKTPKSTTRRISTVQEKKDRQLLQCHLV